MFFNLCFPAIDPWTDLEEVLTPPEPADAGGEHEPRSSSAPPSSHGAEHRDGECVERPAPQAA
jgi:hypothetical protein